jgi:glycosyltransferase involved in cell wall biosynthesis
MGQQAARSPRCVLMVTGAYYPEISSGGTQCRQIARALAGRVYVSVLTTAIDPKLPADDQVDGVPVSRVFIDVTSPASRIAALVRMTVALVPLIRRADVVHIHGCSGKNVLVTLVAKLMGRPIVLSLHTAGQDEPEAIRRSGRLSWWAFTSADLYLSVSPGLVAAYLAAGLPRPRIRQVPNGIDTDRFAPATLEDRRRLRERFQLSGDRPVIVFVGFFSSDKQPRVLFDAWVRLRTSAGIDADLVYVGATASPYFEVDDRIAGDMRSEAAQRGWADRLVLVGSTHDVQDYLRAADLFALPSRREGLPVALLEAMACGLPCVASDLSGSTDAIIENGRNGVLVPVGDSNAFADAMATLIADRQKAAAIGAAARDTVTQRFALGDVAKQWLAAYDLDFESA